MNDQAGDVRMRLALDATSLAKFRTQLALDRTTLGWLRTTLTMATFGFGTVGFFRSLRGASPTPETIRLHESAITFGVALIVLGLVATVASGLAHWFALRRLRRGEAPKVNQWPLSITVALLSSLIGLVALYLLFSR